MYGEGLVERYVAANNVTSLESLTGLLDDFHIAATMLEPGTPAVTVLDLLPGWTRLHTDETAVVHVRTPQARAP